jgi:hypothetical protein
MHRRLLNGVPWPLHRHALRPLTRARARPHAVPQEYSWIIVVGSLAAFIFGFGAR